LQEHNLLTIAGLMTDGYTFNRVEFTANEETCILKYLVQAQNRNSSDDEQWQSVIDSILQKFFNSNIKEAQEFQTL
jgi:ATP-dependent Clp protease adapter protein ClpS